MSTTKWESGQALINRDGVRIAFSPVLAGMTQEQYEQAGWFVDAPAEKRERVLADGWSVAPSGWGCSPCGTVMGGTYAKGPVGARRFFCTPCAEAAGAFATPAPAKPACKPAKHSGWVQWVGSGSPPCAKCKAPGVWFHHAHGAGCAACAPSMLGFSAPETDDARAKPAEPKPAPAEKAKREWKAQIEGTCTLERPNKYAEWAALQTGVAPGLEREKRAISVRGVRGVRSIYLPPTESQGERLSRLVESGARADGRLDETRFEAGLRGRR